MKILIIQTAYLGDVILATALVEKLHAQYPHAVIDFLIRKGNEQALQGNPHLRNVLVFDKKQDKYRNLFRLLWRIRNEKYDEVINVQRFASSGFLAAFSGAGKVSGYKKNPFSFLFHRSLPHNTGSGLHELQRNQSLIEHLCGTAFAMPRLYPSAEDQKKIQTLARPPYICLAPASVWFTKQFPAEKWVDFLQALSPQLNVYLIGAASDAALCDSILKRSGRNAAENLCGKLTITETAQLIKGAQRSYTNDSAPLHICTAMNAPVTAIFCSTVPSFGFGPMSDDSKIIEVRESLACRPCGLHGYKACPTGHFKCAMDIDVQDMLVP